MNSLPDIQSMLFTMGKAKDVKVAETMLLQRTVFWVRRDTWAELEIIFDLPFGFPINNIISLWAEWGTSSSSDSFGWIVQIVWKRSDDDGKTVLLVRSLHQDEFHRHNNINVTSPGQEITLRRIRWSQESAYDEPLWCRIGQIVRGWFLATPSSWKLWDGRRGLTRSTQHRRLILSCANQEPCYDT